MSAPLRCFVLLALASALTSAQTLIHDFPSAAGTNGYGLALDTMGDLDGDGLPDLLVGAPFDGAGRVAVISSLDGHALVQQTGWQPQQLLGWSAATLGDLDLDGFPDFIVGAPYTDGPQQSSGLVRLVSGDSGATIAEKGWTYYDEMFGYFAGAVGDLDADGLPDFAAGTLQIDGGGFGLFPGGGVPYSGATKLQFSGFTGGTDFRPAGDVDGDGHPDYLVWDNQQGNQLYLCSGANGAKLDSYTNDIGIAVAGGPAADFDGDGRREYVFMTNEVFASHLITITVRSLGHAPLLQIEYVDPHGDPSTVDARYDVTGDGVPDVVVGCPELDLGSQTAHVGGVRIFSGVDGRLVSQIDSQTAGSHLDGFGGSLAIVGDWDGDGVFDIAAGPAKNGTIPTQTAGVEVFSAPLDPPWADLGHVLGGDGGTPLLSGHGALVAGASFHLDLVSAKPLAPVALVVGLSAIDAPFKGGVLVPAPDLVLGLVVTDGGFLSLASHWPAGIPAGISVILQAWITDASGPHGLVASNGLMGTSQG